MVKRIAVTGGAGQIAYSLLFRLARGELLSEPIALHILELPDAIGMLEGVVMELNDCAFPLLQQIIVGSDPRKVFEGVDYAFLVGAKPRTKGMERGELLKENGKIFIEQGKALNGAASSGCKVLVVGNPCNTNCLIGMQNAPDLAQKNWHAMMRLDQNRATYQLAQKARRPVTEVTHLTIWGNHSSTQVPDFLNARISGKPAAEVIGDRAWLEGPFITTVQKRGAAVIEARGKSSAASAASAALDAMGSIIRPTPKGHWFSSAVLSDGNPYGIADGLIFSFPIRSKGEGEWEFVPNLELDPFLRERLQATEEELLAERREVL
ncbi:MAG: malate dehydrogenase [Parachlamydiales bacterium]